MIGGFAIPIMRNGTNARLPGRSPPREDDVDIRRGHWPAGSACAICRLDAEPSKARLRHHLTWRWPVHGITAPSPFPHPRASGPRAGGAACPEPPSLESLT